MIKFDSYLNKYVEKYVYLFKNIHPNVITGIGIISNYFIYHYYFNIKNYTITSLLLILRVFLDSLDGMIARKFNKISKLGGYLDTICDTINVIIISYGIFVHFRLKYSECKAILVGVLMIYYLYSQDALFVHKNFNKDKSIFNKIIIFLSENTYSTTLLIIILIYLKNK